MRVPLAVVACLCLVACASAGANESPERRAVKYLLEATQRHHRTIDVYTDDGAAGNHFVARARMSLYDDRGLPDRAKAAVPSMNEAWTQQPYRGATCIRASMRGETFDGLPVWGAWYFLNGVKRPGAEAPEPNWGQIPRAGFDLTGATRLTFAARGERGGERVDFFAFGVGHPPGTPAAHPDSSPKVHRSLTLTREWTRHSIVLSGLDLSYVLGGFGWAVSGAANGLRDVAFYLDDIQYELDPGTASARANEPHFAVSYETAGVDDFDRVNRASAHAYDNALVVLALLAEGESTTAKVMADAFVEAQAHDRFRPASARLRAMYRGSVRNAYQGGDLFLPPGWAGEKAVRLPGWYGTGDGSGRRRWMEDRYSVSLDAGNMAWAMLALLAYHDLAVGKSESPYLRAAQDIGEWIERNCRTADGVGYTGGYNGWEPAHESDEATPERAPYRSTEHNIDLYAAFERLHLATGDAVWRERSERALQFVREMWDDERGVFWTGTEGETVNQAVVPLDVQAWAVLALRNESLLPPRAFSRALDYAESHMRVANDGYDYSRRACTQAATRCDDRRGVWYEGTAQMAAAYQHTGRAEKSREILAAIARAQLPSGALPSSDRDDGLPTGFVRDGIVLRYYKRPHIGATAWFVLAAKGSNPYWLGTGAELR